jgi:hypothetical protein
MSVSNETQVSEVEINIDDILNPGAASVMVPEDKSNLFTRKPEDLTFLDKKPEDDPPAPPMITDPIVLAEGIKAGTLNEDGTPKVVAPTKNELDEIINTNPDDDPSKTGRPKVSKDALYELATKLIANKTLIPFDDDKPLDKYTVQDFEELFQANMEERERKIATEIPAKFFDSLPQEMQYAAKYIADGGKDLKGLFKMLAATEEVRSLDPAVEGNDEAIVRTYLQATGFGDDDDITEEINGWKDRNELPAKAAKFKPKLDAMQEEILADKLARQEHLQKQQQAQARQYMDNVYKVLEPGELNGIKLDRKTQGLLYSGLTQPNYPSVSGKQTNLLGHLLEKHQFVEPNHALIAEALYLLADPEGYRAKVRESAEKKVTEKVVRSLKTEEARKLGTGADDTEEPENKPFRIPRPSNNLFKR